MVDATGKNVLVANYGGGSVAVLPIGPDGKLAPASDFIQHKGKVFDPRRQGSPHAHSINLDKANRFAVVADLGLDRVFVYKFDPIHGKLSPNDPPATKVKDRSGPRHFAFHPDGKHAYVINEINCTVTAFDYDRRSRYADRDPDGADDARRRRSAGIRPPRLWSTRRVSSSTARTAVTTAWPSTAIEPATGRLKLVEYEPTGGKTPRNFAVDPTGAYVLAENMSSDTIVVFRVDPATGALEPTGQVVEVPKACCVKFVPVEK